MHAYRVDITTESGPVPTGFTIAAENVEQAYNLAVVALKRLKAEVDISSIELSTDAALTFAE